MPDTLSREELDEIRGRDARAADDPHTWTVADRRALLAHIDALTAAVEERREKRARDRNIARGNGQDILAREIGGEVYGYEQVLAILNWEHR